MSQVKFSFESSSLNTELRWNMQVFSFVKMVDSILQIQIHPFFGRAPLYVVLRIASPRPGMERYFSSLRPANANAMQLGPRYEMGPLLLGET